jgi:hypothetical protein
MINSVISVNKSGNGNSCELNHGASAQCEFGQGQCVKPDTDVNCLGGWGDCSVDCGRIYTITTPASGGGDTCPYDHFYPTLESLSYTRIVILNDGRTLMDSTQQVRNTSVEGPTAQPVVPVKVFALPVLTARVTGLNVASTPTATGHFSRTKCQT